MGRKPTLEERICDLFEHQVKDAAEREKAHAEYVRLENELEDMSYRHPRPGAGEFDAVRLEARHQRMLAIPYWEENRSGYGEIDPDEPVRPLLLNIKTLVPRVLPGEPGVDRLADEQIVYVTAYTVTREYGGAEEGGWYYDEWTHILSIPCLYRDTPQVIKDLETGALEGYNHGDIQSVLGGQEVRYYIEYIPGTKQTRVRPRYC
jgi:hypothetical protein